MDLIETAELLAVIASFDRRTVGETDVRAWQLALSEVRAVDAQQVVVDHYRDSRDWIMPSDIRHGVAAMRRARLVGLPSTDRLVADVGFDDPAWHVLRKERREAIANGLPAEQAIREITAESLGLRQVTA